MSSLHSCDTSFIPIQSAYPAGEIKLFVRIKGKGNENGEVLLLLHGYPQTGR